jgi:hypothetical protein
MDLRIQIRTKMSWIRNTAFNHKMQEPTGDTRKNHTPLASNQQDQSQTASSLQNLTFADSSQLRKTPAAFNRKRKEPTALNQQSHTMSFSNHQNQSPTASSQQNQSLAASNHDRQEPTGDSRKNHTPLASNQQDQSQTASSQQKQTFVASSQSNQQNQSPTAFNQVSQSTEAFNEECQKFLLSNCRRQEETVSTSRIQSCLAAESWIQAVNYNRIPEAPSFLGDALARRRSFLLWGRAEEEEEVGRETCEKRTGTPLADEGFPPEPDQSDSKLETSGVRGENSPKKHKGRLVQ